MNNAIIHRGPDDDGVFAGNGFAFGMRRLSIIDLSGGHQPIWSTSEGQGCGIVFNGEIYNYQQLRNELQNNGISFKSNSDTEVILRLYEAHGLAAIDKLEGMFAIAIIDYRANKLHLVRDRVGIKPLYYLQNGKGFYFASELKSIIEGIDAKPSLDLSAIDSYLTYRYVPGEETIWQNCKKLAPGHILSFDITKSNFKISSYWSIEFNSAAIDPSRDYDKEFELLFTEAVNKRLVASDVPVGVLLSGGLDSSAVAAAAINAGHTNFNTFSIGFDEGEAYNELGFAREVAEFIGSTHHEVVIGQEDFIDFLPRLVHYTDEPLADLASVPLHYVSKLAAQNVKVVLSGEGADEILAGYHMDQLSARMDTLAKVDKLPSYILSLAAKFLPSRHANVIDKLREGGLSKYLINQKSHMTWVHDFDEKATLWLDGTIEDKSFAQLKNMYEVTSSLDPIDQIQQVYFQSWLVEDLLMKADKMSMANSLELRVPFLDHKLVEWAAVLPKALKVGDSSNWTTKKILRNYAKKYIPQTIIDRPKKGFPVPAYFWLRQAKIYDWAREVILESPMIRGLFNRIALEEMLKQAHAGQIEAAHKTWSFIILSLWMSKWQ